MAGHGVWEACGEHPKDHEADDGMEQLGQASLPPAKATRGPRFAHDGKSQHLTGCRNAVFRSSNAA